jgi:hypothetical protein
MSHHRAHIHFPCLCDLTAKMQALGGALKIVRKDIRACKAAASTSMEELVEDTPYDIVRTGGRM